MSFTIVDAIIILFLLIGALIGFKRGIIQSATIFLGIIFVIILAYYLKNPLSKLMYTYLPFFEFSGALKGVTVLNILIYEAIAFLVVFFVLDAILQIAIKATGILEKILKFTIVLGIPSKIAGAIFGLLEQFIYVFVFLFLLSRLSFTASYINESNLAPKILNNTPIVSSILESSYQAFDEIYSLKEKYENRNDEDSYNREALDILLKYDIITIESTENLIENEKLKIPDVDSILNKYRQA